MPHKKFMKNRALFFQILKDNESIFDFIENYSLEGFLVLDDKVDLFWLNPKLCYNLGVIAANQKIELNDIIDNDSILRIKDIVNKSKELKTDLKTNINNNDFEVTNLTFKNSNGLLINYEVYFNSVIFNDLTYYLFGFKTIINTFETEQIIKYSKFAKIEDYLKLKNVIFNTYQLLFVINEDYRIIDFWAKNEELLYKKPNEFLGINFLDLGFSEEINNNLITIFNEFKDTNSTKVFEYSLFQNNETIYYLANISCFIDSNKKKEYLILVKDITEEKLNKIKVDENNAKFLSLFESSHDAILLADAESGILVDANQAAERLFNGPKEKLIGMHQSKIHPPEDLKYVVKKFIEYTENNDFKLIETRVLCLDGTIKQVEISSSLNFEINGKILIAGYFRDITDRKKIEKDLEFNRFLLEESQRIAKLGSWNFDFINDKLTWTKNLYHVFEADEQTFHETHNSFVDLVTDYDKERVLNTSKRTQETGEPFEIEYDIITPKGNKKTIVEHGFAEKDQNGKIIRLFGTAQDITVEKEIINKVKENEERLSFITNNISDTIWVLNLDKKAFTYISPSIYKLRGLTVQEALSENFEDSMSIESLNLVNSLIEKNLKIFLDNPNEQNYYITEIQQYNKNQELKWDEITTTFRFNNYNEIEILGVSRDIEARKQAELNLIQSHNEFNAFFDTSIDAFFFMSLDTPILWNKSDNNLSLNLYIINNLKFTKVNNSFLKIFNKDIKDILGNSVLNFNNENEVQTLELVNNIFKFDNYNHIFSKTIDSKTKWFNGSFVVSKNSDNYVIGVYGVIRDITNQKEFENEILNINNRYYDLAKQSKTVAWEVDKFGLYTYISDIIEDVTDYKVSEIVGKLHFYDVFPDKDKENIKNIAFEIFENKANINALKNKIQKKNGEIIWVETYAYPILDENGDLLGYRGNDIDITERQVNEEKLTIINQNNSETLKAIDSSSIVSITDNKGIIISVNQMFCDISKYEAGELIGQYHNIINSGYHPRSFWISMWKTIAAGKVWKGEIKNRAKDGKEYWVYTVITPIRDINGEIVNYFSIRYDITQKKQIELELLKRDKIFKDLSEHIPGAIWQLVMTQDNRLYFQYVSYNLSEMLEIDEDLLKKDANIAISRIQHIYQEEFYSSLNRSKNELSIWNVSFKVELIEKGERWLNIIATPKKQNDGSIIWNGFINDVTDDKILELEIERMAFVAKNANDIVIITDANGYIEWVNKAYEKITGYKLKDAIGKKPGSLVQGPETDKFTIKKIRDAIRARVPINTRILNYNINKERYWLDLSINPVFDSKGEVRYFVAIEKDITDIVDYENRLLEINKNLENLVEERTAELRQANEDLIKLNREKDRFVGLATHDLKNPLASILLTTDLLQIKLKRNNPDFYEDYSKYLQNIIDTSNRMNNIIMEFLNINKLQSGNFQLQKEYILLEEVCHNVLGVLDVRAKNKNIELVVEFECYDYFFLDRNSIVQISDNLISNAIKFSYPKSKVYVRCNYFDNKLYIEIEDSGQGMNEDDLKNLYNSFKKLSSKPTAGESSTGLGLSIVKYLVDLCGGEIICTSVKGVGTKFTVILPTETRKTLDN